ncbi:MAG: acyl--CoA ligase [Treponema sp.]|jgi:acyl-CoA synthetase (AMP-forming)/AMP-acid ligase II|nr:acyl--CoA ligase [Treponema sp.]
MKNTLQTIPTLLVECCRKFGKKPAIVLNNGLSISYKDMMWGISRTAQILREQGVSKNSKVALFMNNCPQSVETFLAITHVGAVALMLKEDFSKEQIDEIIKAETPDVVFINENTKNLVCEDTNATIMQISDNRILKSIDKGLSRSGYIIKSSDPAAIVYEIQKDSSFSRRIITHKEISSSETKTKNKQKAMCKKNKIQQITDTVINFAKLLSGRSVVC